MFRFLQIVAIFSVLPLALFLVSSAALGSFRHGWRYTVIWLKVIGAMVALAAVVTFTITGFTPLP